jgi:hypothetical protein
MEGTDVRCRKSTEGQKGHFTPQIHKKEKENKRGKIHQMVV